MLPSNKEFIRQLNNENSIIKLCKTLNNIWIALVHPDFKEDYEQLEELQELINQRVYDIIVNHK